MPTIDVEWTAQSNLRPQAIELATPLIEMTALWASMLRRRMIRTGRDGRGQRLSKYTPATVAKRRRQGKSTFKNLEASGTMWRSLRAKLQTPTRANVVFTGKARRGFRPKKGGGIRRTKKGRPMRIGNSDLARILQDKEKIAILQPSGQEVEDGMLMFQLRLTRQALTALAFESLGFEAEKRARSIEHRAKKALAELRRGR